MTTTDPFTEAASEEACARFLIDADHPGPTSLAYIEVFESAAAWARTHLAAQKPTDAEVEAAAKALAYWDGADGWDTPGWSGHVPETSYVHGARKALAAARAARRDEEQR